MATFPLPRAAESKYSANRFRHKSSYVTRFQYNSIESHISLASSQQSVPIKYNLVWEYPRHAYFVHAGTFVFTCLTSFLPCTILVIYHFGDGCRLPGWRCNCLGMETRIQPLDSLPRGRLSVVGKEIHGIEAKHFEENAANRPLGGLRSNSGLLRSWFSQPRADKIRNRCISYIRIYRFFPFMGNIKGLKEEKWIRK